MKNIWIAFLIGSLISIPALLFLAFFLRTTRGEYYFPLYRAMGSVYWVVSLLSGAIVTYRFAGSVSRRRIAFYFFLGSVIAWFVSLLVLAALNLTPLCIGQDNGDGNNDVKLCMLYVLLISIAYSPFAFFLTGIASFVASRLIPLREEERHPK